MSRVMVFAQSRAAVVFTALVIILLSGARTRAAPQLAGAALEEEAAIIDAMLIAPCCFSQQVSVHKSPAADEAKADIRARLSAGQSRADILDAYVTQYGKRVLAEPPAEGFDRTLYVLPFVVFFASVGLVMLAVRRFTVDHQQPATTVGRLPVETLETRLDDELRDLD